ncbi:hypothetical protein G6O69_17430 [Pseudenhygromyxa sp. WMMC2535]|uniref:hypothetical protein n=1 Tax=Pseudenhygromyxa sp. WMMC2535 TaxID=2712867 RepID=UPI00155298D4|nr:hypothetical protein [Pseudenhygromyxa sp. WMMC2535]NVB39628.1 hypothetical protein [Pseudenhygromyxa sp. WMMC2535]
MFHTLLFSSLLLFTPPEGAGEAPAEAAGNATPTNFSEANALLLKLTKNSRLPTEQAIPALRAAIESSHEYAPSFAADEEARERQVSALLLLARELQRSGENEEAAAVMDEAIRTARDDTPNAGQFGPTLEELHDERMSHIEAAGVAQLKVDCARACKIYVDERMSEEAQELPLGEYRVWVEDVSGKFSALRVTARLTEVDEVVTVRYAPKPKPKVEALELQVPEASKKPERERLLAGWGELILAGVGAGGVVGGSVLIHEAKEDGGRSGGYALVVIGGGLYLTGVILAIVDETRASKRDKRKQKAKDKRKVELGWPIRF